MQLEIQSDLTLEFEGHELRLRNEDRRLVARHVDDVRNVGVRRREHKVHQAAVAAARLALDLLAPFHQVVVGIKGPR